MSKPNPTLIALSSLLLAFLNPLLTSGQVRQPFLADSKQPELTQPLRTANPVPEKEASVPFTNRESFAAERTAGAPSMVIPSGSAAFRSRMPILADGTAIDLRAAESVSSADAKVGDSVDFVVIHDVLLNGFQILPKGTIAQGTISEVKRKGRLARGGRLGVHLEFIGLPNGDRIPVRASTRVRGGSKSKMMATGIAVTALTFYPAAPALMMIRGKDSVLLKGAALTAYVDGDVALNLSNSRYAGVVDSSPVSLKINTPPGLKAASAKSPIRPGHTHATLEEILEIVPRRIMDSSGREGDMVNLIFVGTRKQVEQTFLSAGWETTIRSKFKAVFHAMRHPKDQVNMPMSRLYLFGRPQDLCLAMEDPESTMTRRHHIRLWQTDYDLNGVPVWVGAATHDIGVEKDKRSFTGIAHKIDPNVDDEREFVGQTMVKNRSALKTSYILPPNPVVAATTATGGSYYSDGRILLLNLDAPARENQMRASKSAEPVAIPR